ncbi:hypothetical protein [Nitrospirillum bahiense]|uniref:Uncharacterized protein n=1 Tax=Nitrospirillum amazonense TaxID=28077 RepID=A0A560FJ83_9PROT|nr:hypothetical protein [Nitrospirillum amazonense]TWB21664.1 hypothetical protein FBZ88_11718 [Nitrospirillum amazonense]
MTRPHTAPILLAWALLAGLTLVNASESQAKEVDLLAPHWDFSLREPSDPPAADGPAAYASTAPGASWNLVAWNISGGDLPPFTRRRSGNVTVFSSTAREASVTIIQARNATHATYKLTQDGAVLPCQGPDGRPRESDLFASPSGKAKPPHESVGVLADGKYALTDLDNLFSDTDVRIKYENVKSTKGCAVSQGGPLISVVLNNPTSHQTLFYQLALSMVCGPQPEDRQRFCNDMLTKPRTNYFFTKDPFGVDDSLPLLGQPFLKSGERRDVRVDILPRLLKLIAEAPAGMDKRPENWRVGGYYNGQHIWGDITLESEWTSARLIASPKAESGGP